MKRFISLALCLCLVTSAVSTGATAALSCSPTAQTVLVDGREIKFDAYIIDGNNYFKLRDVAFILNGTRAQFELGYDAAKKLMLAETGSAYTPVGGELSPGEDRSASCAVSAWELEIDGVKQEAAVYMLGGNNYFKLRDLGRLLDFGVLWNPATFSVEIWSDSDYEEETSYVYERFNPSKNAAAAYLKARLAAGCPIASYETDDRVLETAAYTYDNALCALAFIANGDKSEARQVLDALVTGVESDRYSPNRVRNAYRAGDAKSLPGWWDGRWYEDAYQVGSNVGNTSYATLALLQYDRRWGDEGYVATARKLMDWVLYNCADGGVGFTAGYDGWPENGSVSVYTYKSTEHNIDACIAFQRLFALTGERKYEDAAASARAFVLSMYSAAEGRYYEGTTADGKTPSTARTALDAQVWTALAMGESGGVERALEMKTPEGGYPFCEANANGGYWPEGTAFTALTLRKLARHDDALSALDAMEAVQLVNGSFPASTVPVLDTGGGWEYYDIPHIAPAAWYVMAVCGFDPYGF